MLCPSCQTKNHGNAKQCKVCHHPLVKSKQRKHSWPLAQKIALCSVIVAVLGFLVPTFAPEIRQLAGLDRPVYARLKQKYLLQSAEAGGKKIDADIRAIVIDRETPDGEVDGHVVDNNSQTSCQFTGNVTPDNHFSFQCYGSPDKFVNGYINSDGSITGDMEKTNSLGLIDVRRLIIKGLPNMLAPIVTPSVSPTVIPTISTDASPNPTPVYHSPTSTFSPAPMYPTPTPTLSPTPESLPGTETPNVNESGTTVAPSPVPSQTVPASHF